jgi:hypothetical protein
VAAIPGLDVTDRTCLTLDGPHWSIDLWIGADDPIHSIMVSVRGSGDDVLPVIAKIGSAVGGRIFDPVTNDYLTGGPADATGWDAFQAFRDRATWWQTPAPSSFDHGATSPEA